MLWSYAPARHLVEDYLSSHLGGYSTPRELAYERQRLDCTGPADYTGVSGGPSQTLIKSGLH